MNGLLLSFWFNIVTWLSAGAVIGIVSINPLLSILLFDLPLTLKYHRKGYFQVNTPFLVYGLGLLFFGFLGWFCMQMALVAAKQFYGYCITGIGLCVAVAILDLWFNPRNFQDFIRDNEPYFSPLGQHHLVNANPSSHRHGRQAKQASKRSSSGLLRWFKRYLSFKVKLGAWEIVVE